MEGVGHVVQAVEPVEMWRQVVALVPLGQYMGPGPVAWAGAEIGIKKSNMKFYLVALGTWQRQAGSRDHS